MKRTGIYWEDIALMSIKWQSYIIAQFLETHSYIQALTLMWKPKKKKSYKFIMIDQKPVNSTEKKIYH